MAAAASAATDRNHRFETARMIAILLSKPLGAEKLPLELIA